ncbi:sulfite exporter TauE/SafE family protein [Candidatus Falkowbacteria bacterium CG10_big_fil_rev_8_21_14_0_10_39_9]|uniref:Probable membrane transporter protein n=1 Tax=Candidatus Falkowbacteria bacterium CG10_big_fil_rev_8_21_14_0_10_39_9 TaxID=1974566 RepID=A0A2M6WQZ2_9BACT|nr:MAG: sulfite exporter TauE/SafE family protein [Candidatus Falkowbacteria bacterium CG10_big_fil_rev_8_21_14_0_10_39_9]
MTYLIYLITGLLAGVIGGLLSTGGCAIMMPVIRFGFHFDPAIAVGTTLTAVVFTAASGAYQHIKMKNVDKKTSWIVALSGILGVIIGSIVFGYIKNYGNLIDLILGFVFLVVSFRMLYEGVLGRGPKNPSETQMPGTKTSKGILGSSIGFLTGIIGLGGGYALVPSFIYFFEAPVKLAIGTSMASFVWIALIGAAFKIYQGVVNIPVAITLGIGALIGAIYGAKLMAKFKPNWLKALFGIMFLYVSLKYILIYFGIAI